MSIGPPPREREGVEADPRQRVAQQSDPTLGENLEDYVTMTGDPDFDLRHENT